ncbi:putative N-acetylmannosamine-6-phosphate 2-epimerase [Dellaglioa algida]|uniref:Putative N-acetylmannosamine-6-phosphate 2-epimerase n=2 Tax=Dellaglioa algida TaxID=105612 RepID=A0A5C6MAV7_9LACO|nr:N-acetylmannosamine-6-phosphate 2-epimerase [Dellaglioa algida]MDK1717067.1 N-acetylmannosamine-6-phosphate 2-epimerase [Dellaglioa algida]MDK1719863.1 N-acetylmannosamine-6-phosphate 2-epimerase [Dellaglioa algida]MDK1722009.1 N-acetylmannosamine-6-phosphate 2-epimerase [Dellaglioa algida]MDK1723206.1 N-acetylmannosamine-6-phosphate 2-epimerase [Dellaglioa algida]MDK1739842.1 N-acetylmannosamine-6-phosphate 2-epimerase [Dellaglioa algida]
MNLNDIKDGLVVSCQALENEPLYSSFIMGKMALAAELGGAVGIRANSVADILEIKKQVNLPLIGIIKRDYPDSEVYITATMKEVDELLTTDAEIIAMDATVRDRPNHESVTDLVGKIHTKNRLVMADISTYEEGIIAEKNGFDMVSTTLSGYTDYTDERDSPDFELLKKLVGNLKIPVIMEGHTTTPEEVKKALNMGAFSAVVGGVITRPQQITQRFVDRIS